MESGWTGKGRGGVVSRKRRPHAMTSSRLSVHGCAYLSLARGDEEHLLDSEVVDASHVAHALGAFVAPLVVVRDGAFERMPGHDEARRDGLGRPAGRVRVDRRGGQVLPHVPKEVAGDDGDVGQVPRDGPAVGGVTEVVPEAQRDAVDVAVARDEVVEAEAVGSLGHESVRRWGQEGVGVSGVGYKVCATR